jgi:steroid delta-isomerase-like uncharacterized protein
MRVAAWSIALLLVFGLSIGVLGDARGAAQEATPTACPATTPEQNADLVRRYVDLVYNHHDPAAAAQFLADDFNRTNPARAHQNEPGTADDVARVQRSLTEFPDLFGRIDDLIATGDRVVVRMTVGGTQQGGFADWGAPPTGRPAEWSLIVIWRVACGKLAENWVEADRLTELRQLGIITDDELTTAGTPSVATPTLATPVS